MEHDEEVGELYLYGVRGLGGVFLFLGICWRYVYGPLHSGN